MSKYFQFSRKAAWALFVVTPLLALLACVVAGFVLVFVGFIQHLMVPEKPWEYPRALWFGAWVLLPALVLMRFYFVVAARVHSSRYAMIGWGASACYHAGLTWLFVFSMPGRIQASGSPVELPLWVISGLGLGASVYLAVRYPRPPKLRGDDDAGAASAESI